jgi:hypothetical protein
MSPNPEDLGAKQRNVLAIERHRYGSLVGTLILSCQNPICMARSIRIVVDEGAPSPEATRLANGVCPCCGQPASFVDFEPATEREAVRTLQRIEQQVSYLSPP